MEYQLVLQLPADNNTDYDLLVEIGSHLETDLSNEHYVDGHDFGSGQMNIFIHTNSPELAFTESKQVLSKLGVVEFKAAYRKLEAEEYTWLWPTDANDEFLII